MKAVAFTRSLTISQTESLFDLQTPAPVPGPRDLLVRVKAVSVNPVDTKVRASAAADAPLPEPRVLGWDAAGVIEVVGDEVKTFRAGDEVYYAGDLTRPGSNAELQLVDERLVGRKPAALSFADAAAFPLVTITAWESLFERLGVDGRSGAKGRSILIIGGAGGVGSIAIQLARGAGLTVIATASRPETREWVKAMGAHHVADHGAPLPAQLAALGFPGVDYIANFNNTDAYWAAMAEMIKPFGKIVGIVETESPVDMEVLKAKSATFAWEFMFTRSKFQTPDMAEQGRLLDEVSLRINAGEIKPLARGTIQGINAATLRAAHARVESGKVIGKLVVAGW